MAVKLYIMSEPSILSYIYNLKFVLNQDHTNYLAEKSRLIAQIISQTHFQNKLIAIIGNGGSAADAQHWVGELVCTYQSPDRLPIAATSLTCNTSILTAWANDRSYDEIFERQISALSSSLGLVIGLSTSGKSNNILQGLQQAKKSSICTVLISGNQFKIEHDYIDHLITIQSTSTPIIQTITQIFYHSVCQELECL